MSCELVDIRISVGNLNAVTKSLIWIECFLNNLKGYDDSRWYYTYFEQGLQVVQTVCMANLSIE